MARTGQAGLVGPVDFAALRPGLAGNRRIGALQPCPDRPLPPLGGPAHRPLRGEAPAAQIIANHRQAQPHPGLARDQRPHRVARPQRKRQTILIRGTPGRSGSAIPLPAPRSALSARPDDGPAARPLRPPRRAAPPPGPSDRQTGGLPPLLPPLRAASCPLLPSRPRYGATPPASLAPICENLVRLPSRSYSPAAGECYLFDPRVSNFSFTPIDVPGSSFTNPFGINDAGQIV